jgi:hypothetical protein
VLYVDEKLIWFITFRKAGIKHLDMKRYGGMETLFHVFLTPVYALFSLLPAAPSPLVSHFP